MVHKRVRFKKAIRLSRFAYEGTGRYFVTICCHQRQRIFASPARCRWLIDIFRAESAARHFMVHAYCLMPDHFHFLIEGTSSTSNLLGFVKSFKIKSSRLYDEKTSRVLWQNRYFDHILRSGESPESVAWYIWMNPVRAKLSSRLGEYPFAGSFTGLMERLVSRSPELWIPPWKPTKAPASEGGRENVNSNA
jgi:REP element-mobilizing transposase RayT